MDQQHWANNPVTLRGRALSKYKHSISCESDRNFDDHERVCSTSLSKEANKVHTIALILVVIVIQAVKVIFEKWKF